MTIALKHPDDGMTLVELIIVVLVSGVFLTLIALIFGSSLGAQQRATERDAITAQLNAATAHVTETVRSSSDIKVNATGTRVDARFLKADGVTWECRAWAVVTKQLRYSAGASARSADTTTWKLLASGMKGTLGGGTAFAQSGKRLSLGLEQTQGQTTVAVSNGAVAQIVMTGGPACW
ncbi:hypothetical protein CW368_10780 [Actinomycetales bacterium SN12]|nr:hypothetical protein CW368_10780 [Actinomycetales bacterium SN12]